MSKKPRYLAFPFKNEFPQQSLRFALGRCIFLLSVSATLTLDIFWRMIWFPTEVTFANNKTCTFYFQILSRRMKMQMVGASILLLVLFSVDVFCLCPPKTECFGHGIYDRKNETCNCSSSIKGIGPYTGECCESIACKSNATCKHGFCGPDGVTCANCQTGWGGVNCTEVKSCFSWFSCAHGTCVKSRSTCECEPGWVGDLCDRTVCLVRCKFGSCPRDPMKCECHEHYFGTACEKLVDSSVF